MCGSDKMLAIMLRIRQPEKKLNILIGNLNEASGRRKVCVFVCVCVLAYVALLRSSFFFTTLQRC